MTIIHTIQTWRERRGHRLRRINDQCCAIDATMPSPLDTADNAAAATDRLLALIREDEEWSRWNADIARRVDEDLWMY